MVSVFGKGVGAFLIAQPCYGQYVYYWICCTVPLHIFIAKVNL